MESQRVGRDSVTKQQQQQTLSPAHSHTHSCFESHIGYCELRYYAYDWQSIAIMILHKMLLHISCLVTWKQIIVYKCQWDLQVVSLQMYKQSSYLVGGFEQCQCSCKKKWENFCQISPLRWYEETNSYVKKYHRKYCQGFTLLFCLVFQIMSLEVSLNWGNIYNSCPWWPRNILQH